MTVIVTNDMTVFDPADSVTGWTGRSPISNINVDTASQVEGSGCIAGRLQAGIGDITYNHGTTDLTDKHIYIWMRASVPVDTFANSGFTIRTSGTSGGASDYGQWAVAGQDLGIRAYLGWNMLTVDLLRPFTTISGTIPPITAITDSGAGGAYLSGSGMDNPAADAHSYGSSITIGGGTTGARGTMAEVATDDKTNGLGFFKFAAGAFFANTKIFMGNSGTADSYFSDSNQVLIFESDMKIASHLLGLFMLGNTTGSNNFRLGSSSGTGINKEGSGGGVIKAAGERPFRIDCSDQNMAAVEFYGVVMVGSSALFDDPVRNIKVEENGVGFTDITRAGNGGVGTSNPNLMPTTQSLNDATYFGHNEIFYELNMNLAVAKGGTWTGTWEYYNGTSWLSLTDLTDGINNYATTGVQTVTYAIPDDWVKNTVDTDNRYWIRFRISSFTSSGTTPTQTAGTGNGITVAMIGDMRLEDSTVEAIGCTFTQMGSIRVRNGAFLKKSTITDSVVPAKHGALDLGSADPTADTVRDLTIQNCIKGILLKGTGNVTYNFRNIKFANNTNDVRVDFGVGDTVTINILEGGDTPTIDNVNGSTVTINNSISITLRNVTSDNEPTEYVRVAMYATAGGDLAVGTQIMEADATTTDDLNSGKFKNTITFNYTNDQPARVVARHDRYKPRNDPVIITSSDFDLNVVWERWKVPDQP